NRDKSLNAGDALGMARMVNITDIFLPTNSNIMIKEGQQTIGGETIIAQFAENATNKKAKTADAATADAKTADE
ncbi:MAG: hypothetical protein K0U39_03090, partial [Alphaproteobacteria bacterium]|nr:hypothetical protein [Alphaproteobacteria bacterium]